MKKRKCPVILIIGACLVLISLSFMIAYQIRLQMGARQSQTIASKINEILPERTVNAPGIPDAVMPALQLEDKDYVALIEIPSFGLVLPVADRWDSGKLSISPARFFGSAYDDTLIIGGIDHKEQFGFCDQISHGAFVTVTDMTGSQFSYTVSKVERSKHAQSQWLVNQDFDLTLFCHDIYSMEYIAVRCNLAYNR